MPACARPRNTQCDIPTLTGVMSNPVTALALAGVLAAVYFGLTRTIWAVGPARTCYKVDTSPPV
jgi:hypothetical protein